MCCVTERDFNISDIPTLRKHNQLPERLRRWEWRPDGVDLIGLGIIGLMTLAGAHDAGRSLVEAVLEGLCIGVLYAPFFALCSIKVEPPPRWWKAAGAGIFILWWGLLPAVAGWMLDYYNSLSDAFIAGITLSSFWATMVIFGGRERWCTAAAGVCILAALGAWIAGLGSFREASVLGFGGAIFFGMLAALWGD
jgi:hypothetical protein